MTKAATPPPTAVHSAHNPPSAPASPLAKRAKTAMSSSVTQATATPSVDQQHSSVTTNVEQSAPLLIQKLSEGARAPTRGSAFAAGYDIYWSARSFFSPHFTISFVFLVSFSYHRLFFSRSFLGHMRVKPYVDSICSFISNLFLFMFIDHDKVMVKIRRRLVFKKKVVSGGFRKERKEKKGKEKKKAVQLSHNMPAKKNGVHGVFGYNKNLASLCADNSIEREGEREMREGEKAFATLSSQLMERALPRLILPLPCRLAPVCHLLLRIFFFLIFPIFLSFLSPS
jgi:hypothetical protein